MVSIFNASNSLFLCFILFSASQFLVINCAEFEVGGRVGWVVPTSKDSDEMYNQWASQNRFKIDDTIRNYHFLSILLFNTCAFYFELRSFLLQRLRI